MLELGVETSIPFYLLHIAHFNPTCNEDGSKRVISTEKSDLFREMM